MTFPLVLDAGRLTPEDLTRFSPLFSKTVFQYFPAAGVHFVPPGQEDEVLADLPEPWQKGIAHVLDGEAGDPYVLKGEEPFFCLPVWGGEVVSGVLLAHGGAQELYDAPIDWLLEQSYLISREFQNIKQSCIDPATGLLNGYHLQEEVGALLQEAAVLAKDAAPAATLALLEVYPRSRDADRSLEYIVRAGAYLTSLMGESLLLHHLGAGIFGLLWYGINVEEARQLGDGLLRRLKRDNFVSAHLGITAVVPHDPELSGAPEPVLEQAWQMLRIARKRGPFGLCAHATKEELAAHPLRPPVPSICKELGRLWRGKDRFALLLLRADLDPGSNHFSKRVRSVVDEDVPLLLLNQREAFVYLDGADEKKAQAWLKKFKKQMKKLGGATFSVGIGLFPFHDFKKSEIPLNCRKAMLHTQFYGPDTVTVFDGVSLNISGDVYYNEGDLGKAIREYRRGLAVDPGNVNLLNSLGVTCVQLNRAKQAKDCFEQALKRDKKNFMALFNLGFVHLHNKDMDEAIRCLEKARKSNADHRDLLQHLGTLYCKTGSYKKAVKVLKQCEELWQEKAGGQESNDFAKVARALGVAYDTLGKNKEAVSYLQRTLTGNPRDAGSLSRLGVLYVQEGQGDDIGVTLCRQAVELDGTKGAHWYRLGKVQYHLGDYEGALDSLRECVRLHRTHEEGRFLLAQVYEKLTKPAQAKRQFELLLRQAPAHKGAQKSLAAYAG